MNAGSELLDAVSARRVVPVGELARRIGALLERSVPALWVGGELSNLTRAASGHWYFSLKDRDAQVRCVMFRTKAQALDWVPREGDRVEARAAAGFYVPRGEFQLQVEQMRRAGAGALFEAFLRIKAKLEAEGLFDAARKRALPAHPRTIAVVTSLQAAALRDVLTALGRRAPHTGVVLVPTPVQGDDAPRRIAEALGIVSRVAAMHAIDVVLLVRGGGSIEDLWAFNDEGVAQAIAASSVPVVSGVGHESDFTIADFVADLRAATPTAAAELASPDGEALRRRIDQRRQGLARAWRRRVETATQRVDEAARRLKSPVQRLAESRARLDALARRLMRAMLSVQATRERSLVHLGGRLRQRRPDIPARDRRVIELRRRLTGALARRHEANAGRLASLRERLALLDPKGILARGYAIVSDTDGHVVRTVDGLAVGSGLRIELGRGRVEARVERVDE